MLYKSNFSAETAVVNQSGAMEADTISKNGRSSKNHTSRGNFLKLIVLFIAGCLSVNLWGQSGLRVDSDPIYWSRTKYKISDFQVAAEKEDAKAQFWLAMLYFYGEAGGANKDNEKAMFWLARAALNGVYDALSLYYLAGYYDNTENGNADNAIALFWYMKMSDAKDYNDEDNEDYRKIRMARIYRIKSDDPFTSSDIGEYKMEEIIKKAAPSYRYYKAAKQGDADAQYNLADCYYNGKGVTKDDTQATYWWHKAAEQGHIAAQFNLGICYKDGAGVEKDLIQTVYWWRKAAEQGHIAAQYNIGLYYMRGTGVEKDPTQTIYWWRKAAEQGHISAQYGLGINYKDGIGVEKDGNTALYWYEKVIENKNGTLSEKNKSNAETCIKELKEQGYSSSRAKTQ